MSDQIALLLSLLVVDLLAAMTPGPNFLVVTRFAIGRGRQRAIAATLGIVTGNLAWALATVLGLVALFALVPWLYGVLKIAGGVYLLYLGVRLWIAREDEGTAEPSASSAGNAFDVYARGALTTLLNPKCAVYFGSIFALFMQPGTPVWFQAAAVGVVVFNTILWYGTVALLFSSAAARRLHRVIRRPVDRLAGTFMAAFGARLLLVSD